jgi:hypothetical protein
MLSGVSQKAAYVAPQGELAQTSATAVQSSNNTPLAASEAANC